MRLALWQLLGCLAFLVPLALEQVSYHCGRKFLTGSSYVLPTDSPEDDRLNAQHLLMQLLFGSNALAPLNSPRAMLDVACGTGIWCQEMAAAFPGAQITGMDMSEGRIAMLSTRTLHRQMPNLQRNRWLAADALDTWPFPDATFDYAHLRFGATFVPEKRWPQVVKELARVVKPGGWVEQVEGALPTSKSADYQYLSLSLGRLAAQRGLDIEAAIHLAERQRAAGLVNVQERRVETGQTPEQQALLVQTTVAGFRNLLPVLKKQLPAAESIAYAQALSSVEKELPIVRRTDIAVWGQKPGRAV